jgi:tRNA threonylcarbamoyladenosine biosynthesis protein TsaB
VQVAADQAHLALLHSIAAPIDFVHARINGGSEAVLPPENVALPRDAQGDWFGAGTGWGYADRLPVVPIASDAGMLPHAEDLLRLAEYAWRRGEAVEAEHAQPVYLRDKVATPKV